MSDLRRLAEFIHDITWDQLPERVRETAALRVLDLVSVAAGAVKDPLVEAAKEALGAVSGCGNVSVWGGTRKYPLATAAMLNAMLAHTLELDDVHTASKTHGSASLIPAAWSCAEYLGKSGKTFCWQWSAVMRPSTVWAWLLAYPLIGTAAGMPRQPAACLAARQPAQSFWI